MSTESFCAFAAEPLPLEEQVERLQRAYDEQVRLNDDLADQRDEADEYIHTATMILTALAGGGSELFGKCVRDVYRADLAFCERRIRERVTSAEARARDAISRAEAAEARLAAREAEIDDYINEAAADAFKEGYEAGLEAAAPPPEGSQS